MSDKVVQEFVADDAQYRRSLENQVRDTVRAQNANEKRAAQSKQAAQEEVRWWKQVETAIGDAVRKQRDFNKAQRGEMITASNFVFSQRNGGALAPTPNWVRATAPPAGYLGYSGGNETPIAGYLGYRGQAQAAVAEQGARKVAQTSTMASEGLAYVASSAASLAAGFMGMRAAVEFLTSSLELRKQRESNAAGAVDNLARGHAIIALNTFDKTEADRERFRAAAKGISARSGMPEGMVAALIGEQAGKGANLSERQIIDAADVAAQLTRHTPEQFTPTTAGIQQIMRIGGVGSKEAASLFQSAAAAAYPGNPELQARMVTQSISSGIANSPAQDLQTVEEIAEYAAAASQVGGEERGEAVRTAMVALIAQQREFGEGRGPWERAGPMGIKFHPKVPGLPTHPREFFEHLQKNPQLGKRFWDKANFERQYEGVLRDMLTNPTGKSADILAETQKLVGINVPALDEQIAAVAGGSPQLKTSTKAKKTSALTEQGRARDLILAKQATIRTDFEKAMALSASGYGGSSEALESKFRGAYGLVSPAEIEDRALFYMKARRDQLSAPSFRSEYLEGIGAQLGLNPSTGRRKDALQYLEDLIKATEETRDEIRALRREAPQPAAGPAANADFRGSSGRSGSW